MKKEKSLFRSVVLGFACADQEEFGIALKGTSFVNLIHLPERNCKG